MLVASHALSLYLRVTFAKEKMEISTANHAMPESTELPVTEVHFFQLINIILLSFFCEKAPGVEIGLMLIRQKPSGRYKISM